MVCQCWMIDRCKRLYIFIAWAYNYPERHSSHQIMTFKSNCRVAGYALKNKRNLFLFGKPMNKAVALTAVSMVKIWRCRLRKTIHFHIKVFYYNVGTHNVYRSIDNGFTCPVINWNFYWTQHVVLDQFHFVLCVALDRSGTSLMICLRRSMPRSKTQIGPFFWWHSD